MRGDVALVDGLLIYARIRLKLVLISSRTLRGVCQMGSVPNLLGEGLLSYSYVIIVVTYLVLVKILASLKDDKRNCMRSLAVLFNVNAFGMSFDD